MVANRIPESEKDWRKINKELEFIWRPYSDDLELMTHILDTHYDMVYSLRNENR